jgi:replicative DNA helicase
MELGKIPPHDIEAEQAVLGSMLTDKDAVIEAIRNITDRRFLQRRQ